jgi:hypothetical protein
LPTVILTLYASNINKYTHTYTPWTFVWL